MSLIIKGMSLPSECSECLFSCYDISVGEPAQCIILGERSARYSRLKNCPLSELTAPHGRLIDADKLQTSIHGCLCETCETFSCEKGIGCLVEDVFNLIDEAQTVIEAEVSE